MVFCNVLYVAFCYFLFLAGGRGDGGTQAEKVGVGYATWYRTFCKGIWLMGTFGTCHCVFAGRFSAGQVCRIRKDS